MARTNITTLVEMIAPTCQSGRRLHPEGVRRDDLQPEQDAGDEEAGVHEPDVDELVFLGSVEEGGDVPEHHDGVEGDERGPRVDDEAAARRNAGEKRPSSRNRTSRRRGPTGNPWRRGSQGAPATMRIGAKKAMRMCSIMWTKK